MAAPPPGSRVGAHPRLHRHRDGVGQSVEHDGDGGGALPELQVAGWAGMPPWAVDFGLGVAVEAARPFVAEAAYFCFKPEHVFSSSLYTI